MSVPKWIDSNKQKEYWQKPWTVPLSSRSATQFKKKLWDHGYVSPHFKRTEAKSKDGTAVPESKRTKCTYHAFCLERVRHECGDRSMGPLSWYRSPAHNAAVGGVSNSQHLEAWATDWSSTTRSSLGGSRFDEVMHRVFANGGRGVQGGTRQIKHVDNGTARTWSY